VKEEFSQPKLQSLSIANTLYLYTVASVSTYQLVNFVDVLIGLVAHAAIVTVFANATCLVSQLQLTYACNSTLIVADVLVLQVFSICAT
jgi:hydroxylamine reductase (hybrid-cluster protein)